MMLIDSKVDYACTVRLKEGVTTLALLPKKSLIRDLVTEIAPPDERL
jgi:succinate dehydrogenase/fumarate reductase-like Fe-S protein